MCFMLRVAWYFLTVRQKTHYVRLSAVGCCIACLLLLLFLVERLQGGYDVQGASLRGRLPLPAALAHKEE